MSTSASATERRGIPAAAFVEDVQTYLTQLNLDVNSALAFLQERQSLLILKCLKASTPGLGLKRQILSVCGLELMSCWSTRDEATVLQKNLENAKASLKILVAYLQFLRDQVTITQVTMARVYNWDVHQRRLWQAPAATAES